MKDDRTAAEEMSRNLHREINQQTSTYERSLDDQNKVQAEIAKIKGELESLGE